MASFFAHSAVALTLGRVRYRRELPLSFWLLSAFCASMPDLDVVGFAFGIRYGDLWGHRGLTHSLAFAVVTGLVVAELAYRREPRFTRPWWGLVAYFSLVTASHGALDALTDGGLGVAFFSPFDTTRYFFPVRPIAVSPIGVGVFFSEWGLRVILSELLWVGIPCLVALALCRFRRPVRGG